MRVIVWGAVSGFVLAFAESGLGLGVVVPGETGIIMIGATLRDPWSAAVVGCAVTLGAAAGDHLGYLIGRRYGGRIRSWRSVGRLGIAKYDRAVELVRRRGGTAVLLSRLVPVVRTLTPVAAGVAHLPYRRFAPASLAGSAAWTSVYLGAGSGAGAAWTAVAESWNPLAGTALVLVVVVLVLAIRRVRRGATAPDPTRLPAKHRSGRTTTRVASGR